MTENRRKVSVIDIAIVILVLLLAVAFAFRTQIKKFFTSSGDKTVTYSFVSEQVDPTVAQGLSVGSKLYDFEGTYVGEILEIFSEESSDSETVTISGTVTTTGYLTDSFVYFENGDLVIPGKEFSATTGTAVYEIKIVSVSAQ